MQTLYYATLQTAQAAGAAVASTTSATTLLPTNVKNFQFPIGFFQFVGQGFRTRAAGVISTTTGPPTITFALVIGGQSVSSGAITTIASASNLTWELDVTTQTRSVGSSNLTFMSAGHIHVQFSATLAAATYLMPASALAVSTAIDNNNATVTIDLQATWSASSANNTITLHQFQIDSTI